MATKKKTTVKKKARNVMKERALANRLKPEHLEQIHKCISQPITPQRKINFLIALREYGVVTYACDKVGISTFAIYKHRKKDPLFMQAWDEAVSYAVEHMEKTAYDRAVNGHDEALHHQGFLTGHKVKKYSDTLLIFMLKGNKPEKYRENVNIQSTNLNLNAEVNLDDISDAQLLKAAQGGGMTLEGEFEEDYEEDYDVA